MAMTSRTPSDADPERDAFTCGTLLTCLYLPGLSKKKPEEMAGSNRPPPATEQDHPAEQEPPAFVPNRAASLEKFECASLCSGRGSNAVLDFSVEPEEQGEERGGVGAIHGYCPSPCFDLPVELIRAGERWSAVASDTPVTVAFVFDGYQTGALKKVASCLAPGVAGGEARPPHLVRFLSASATSSVSPMPPASRDVFLC